MADLADESWVMLQPTSGSTLRELTLRKAQDAGFMPKIAQYAPTRGRSSRSSRPASASRSRSTPPSAPGPARRVSSSSPERQLAASTGTPAVALGGLQPALRQVLALSEDALPTPPEVTD